MFENLSQATFTLGSTGYLAVSVLRLLATLLMAVSTYKLLKARGDKHKWVWIGAMFVISPVLVRIAYEIFRRWIAPSDVRYAKGSTACLVWSVAVYVLSVIVLVASVISMGFGFIRSELYDEPLATFYDVHGNTYDDVYDVPLHDREGNTYTYVTRWFTEPDFMDQDGNVYEGDQCYLTEDGYFFYDADDTLTLYEEARPYDYYTDGENFYYDLMKHVYWDEDGQMWYISGKHHLPLFDFD